MNYIEPIGLVGHLKIFKGLADGSRKLAFEQDNLIVKAAKQVILTTLFQTGITSDPINKLKVGTGGAVDLAGLYPKVESPTQTNLITPLLTLNTVVTADLTNLKVTFLADVDQTQGNGQMLSEAGLFKTSGLIFNVKNHPGITKTSEFSVHYEWSIKLL